MKAYTADEIQRLTSEELKTMLHATMQAYGKGGDQTVAGVSMTRKEIVAEIKLVSTELKDRAAR